MDIQHFEKHIKEAVLMVPEHLRKKIENLAFVVEEDIRPAGLREQRINFRGILLGLYQGVPLPRRSGNYSAVLPDKITIFKKSIELLAGPNEDNIRKLIYEVVHHEIAHYFGMSEMKVREWEKNRRKNLHS